VYAGVIAVLGLTGITAEWCRRGARRGSSGRSQAARSGGRAARWGASIVRVLRSGLMPRSPMMHGCPTREVPAPYGLRNGQQRAPSSTPARLHSGRSTCPRRPPRIHAPAGRQARQRPSPRASASPLFPMPRRARTGRGGTVFVGTAGPLGWSARAPRPVAAPRRLPPDNQPGRPRLTEKCPPRGPRPGGGCSQLG
jgi:hypothetical protein